MKSEGGAGARAREDAVLAPDGGWCSARDLLALAYEVRSAADEMFFMFLRMIGCVCVAVAVAGLLKGIGALNDGCLIYGPGCCIKFVFACSRF